MHQWMNEWINKWMNERINVRDFLSFNQLRLLNCSLCWWVSCCKNSTQTIAQLEIKIHKHTWYYTYDDTIHTVCAHCPSNTKTQIHVDSVHCWDHFTEYQNQIINYSTMRTWKPLHWIRCHTRWVTRCTFLSPQDAIPSPFRKLEDRHFSCRTQSCHHWSDWES